MLTSDVNVQGAGVYAELTKKGAVSQLLITPDGYTQDGVYIGSATVRRVVTPSNPDPSWAITIADVCGPLEEMPTDPGEFAEERFKESTVLLDQYVVGQWEMVSVPFFVEVSDKDLSDIQAGRPPTKLFYRIGQCKIALGYPAEVEL